MKIKQKVIHNSIKIKLKILVFFEAGYPSYNSVFPKSERIWM